MNILITRPLIDSEDLMGKLFSLGHKIIHIPTLKILAVKTEPVDINQYDALIFTSANAIRNLKVVREEKSKLCFCVGSITEKIARQLGYQNTLSAGGTVNALKNLIINSNKINEKNQLSIKIIDEGQGFKEKDTSRIFKRFYSNRPEKFGEHSGLGLNIVKNLVELHDGEIVASNRIDKEGAMIEIRFPNV